MKKLTALLFIARSCLVCWSQSQFTAVLSTVGWRRIGAGSFKCSYTSTARHTAFIKRPFGVVTVHSCKRHNQKVASMNIDLSFRGPWAGFKFSLLTLPLQRTDKKIEN